METCLVSFHTLFLHCDLNVVQYLKIFKNGIWYTVYYYLLEVVFIFLIWKCVLFSLDQNFSHIFFSQFSDTLSLNKNKYVKAAEFQFRYLALVVSHPYYQQKPFKTKVTVQQEKRRVNNSVLEAVTKSSLTFTLGGPSELKKKKRQSSFVLFNTCSIILIAFTPIRQSLHLLLGKDY